MIIEIRRHWFINSLAGRSEVTTGSPYFLVAGGPGPLYDDGTGQLVAFASAHHFPLVYDANEGWYGEYELPATLVGVPFAIRAFHPARPGRVLSEEHYVSQDDVEQDDVEDIQPAGSFPQQP